MTAGVPITFRRMMALAALAVGGCVLLLVAGFASGLDQTTRLQAQGDLARTQALLVTRVEADLATLLLAPASRQAQRARVLQRLDAYRRTIADERRLMGGDPAALRAQDGERENADRLAMLVTRSVDLAGLGEARILSQRIAAEERYEAERSTLAIAEVRAAVVWRAGVVVLLAIVLLAGVGWMLWRHVIRPIGALVDATGRLAAEEVEVRVPVRGIAELRDLAMRFNDMAGTVEAQVAARTGTIEAANRCLREVDARRRLFFAKVGHELRTPVTVMRGEAEVALRHAVGDPAAMRAALAQVRDNADFLDRRIEDLLGLARSENGALALRHEAIDLAALVRESGTIAAPFARANGIALSVEASGTLAMHGDPQWLRQAVLTVVDNAVKFSPPDGRVALKLERRGGMALVSVHDEGPGVATGDLDHIFDPYAQTAAGRSRGGAGLGLSLARWIADQHHGAIAAGPTGTGRGLCVSLTLPVLQ